MIGQLVIQSYNNDQCCSFVYKRSRSLPKVYFEQYTTCFIYV